VIVAEGILKLYAEIGMGGGGVRGESCGEKRKLITKGPRPPRRSAMKGIRVM
jgi:hypothetical protein